LRRKRGEEKAPAQFSRIIMPNKVGTPLRVPTSKEGDEKQFSFISI